MEDLNDGIEQVIEDSVNDATASADVVEDVTTDTVTEDVTTDASTEQVATPATPATEDAEDDFDKKFGISAQSITGRENRIPYSRMKKIVAKAEKDTEARVRKELEDTHTTKATEYETKIKDYEGRLTRVAEFENIMSNNPREFLGMLSQVPAYKEFFAFLEKAAEAMGQDTEAANTPILDHSDAPQPDEVLADGSQVYSLQGLNKRDEWLARKIEDRAIKLAEERIAQRYAPIEQQWQSQQEMARMMPAIDKKIAEARTWDKFTDLEPQITEILRNDRNISLEMAYLKAYQGYSMQEREKLSADRNKVRSELLDEIKKKPVASTAPSTGLKPVAKAAASAPRTMEEIIAASIEEAGLK